MEEPLLNLNDGWGIKNFSNGFREGYLVDGKLEGAGRVKYYDKDIYLEGMFRGDDLNGWGKKVVGGLVMEGQFKDSLLNGFGRKVYKNGMVEVGNFRKNQYVGYS